MGHKVFKHIVQTIFLILVLVISAQSKSAEKPQSFQKDGKTYYVDVAELRMHDRRKKKTSSSPAYLDAVGRIRIVKTNGEVSHCSGTLVSTTPGQSSRVIKTAAHCFANITTKKAYDLKSITWTTTTRNGNKIVKNLEINEMNIDRDSAITSFEDKISFYTIKPALIEAEIYINPDELLSYDEQSTIIAAGYSSDSYRGDNGETLTYDDQIKFKDFVNVDNYDRRWFGMKTVSYSGASGGALLLDVDLSYEELEKGNPYKQLYYVGTAVTLGFDTKFYKASADSNVAGAARTNYDSYQGIDDDLVDELNK